jgi:hypothetical protein
MTALLTGCFYGACMGFYSALQGGENGSWQILSSLAKVPLLFLLTLFVTFPSLYVFSALAKTKLSFTQTLRLVLAAVSVNLAILASFGPITLFFTLSTSSYPFMKILNVFFFTISGFIGLGFLYKILYQVFDDGKTAAKNLAGADEHPSSVASGGGNSSRMVFSIWLFLFGVVGAQMGWILRPFIGSPDLPFVLFRGRTSNFFIDMIRTLATWFGN